MPNVQVMPKTTKPRERMQPPVITLAGLRGALGLTQAAVCEQVAAITNKPFTKGALSAIEGGLRGASAETLAALEVALRLAPGSLLTTYPPSHPRRKCEDAAA